MEYYRTITRETW